jgi:hypothetical protein
MKEHMVQLNHIVPKKLQRNCENTIVSNNENGEQNTRRRRTKMGQHKYNPTAIAAKEGKIPPKPKDKLSKRERERLLYAKCQEIIMRPFIEAQIKLQEEDSFKWNE